MAFVFGPARSTLILDDTKEEFADEPRYSFTDAANGNKPIPLYTPNPWESGSSMSHLDDDTFTGSMEKLMNATSDTGLGVRTMSPIEIAIMKDLGYHMVSQSTGAAVLFLGMMIARRRRRR